MSESRNRNFSKYDTMTTEELENVLRLDTSSPEMEESDTELLLYVMGVLANRRKNNSTGKTAQHAWESFQQNYLSETEECSEAVQKNNPIRPGMLWLRRLIVAAAVIALVVCVPVTARAMGWEDIWEIFARWAKETFSFVSGENTEVSAPNPEYDGEYASLQDVLRANKRDANLVPTWIPDRFELKNVEKAMTPVQEIYVALYIDDDETFEIRVRTFLSEDPYNVEIKEDSAEVYTVSGVQYYIFENVDQLQAVWVADSSECIISGDISLDEIKLMIDSIQKG